MKRVGVFSGTFDPFHIAHFEACIVAKAACELDAIVVLVEKRPHRKTKVTPYEHRLAMIDLALQEFPSLRLLEAPSDNLTIDNVLPMLNNQFADSEYYYIVGSDMIEHMHAWHNVSELFKAMKLCVVLRDNHDKQAVENQLRSLKKQYRELDYTLLPSVWSPISSSVIRNEIKANGYSQFVHREVMKYIAKNTIY